MSLERKAIILVDLHGTYLHNFHATVAHRKQVSSEPISPYAHDRSQMPLEDMRPWEWIKPASPELKGNPFSPVATWTLWIHHLGIIQAITESLIPIIDTYYRKWYGSIYATAEEEFALPQPTETGAYPSYWERLARQNYETYLRPYHIKEAERQGGRILTANGHKLIIGTGYFDSGEAGLRSFLQRLGEWKTFAETPPKTLPPMVLRATTDIGMATPYYPPPGDAKLLLYTLMRKTAANSGRDLIGVDDDPEIVYGLTKRGYTMFTPTPIGTYRNHFRTRPERYFDDLSDFIALQDGFSSGLGKLAGLD